MAHKTAPERRSACLNCGRTDWFGFADETIRNGHYGIAVLIVCRCRLQQLQVMARSLRLPGQRRLHFAKERNPRRKLILSAITSSPVSAVYVSERGDSLDARSACWHLLVPLLLARNVSTLVIEKSRVHFLSYRLGFSSLPWILS